MALKDRTDILVIGNLNMDLIFEQQNIHQDARKKIGESFCLAPGGNANNQTVAASARTGASRRGRMGCSIRLLSETANIQQKIPNRVVRDFVCPCQTALVTLPERIHRVQTYTWRGEPSTIAFTRFTLGFHIRLERR